MVRLESGHDSSLSLSLQEKKNDNLEQDIEKKKWWKDSRNEKQIYS